MIFYFLLTVIIFLTIIEIITVMFKLTGLTEEKARFQVISLLTGTGFTTKEAELITQHPGRRKLASIIMILGYVGFFTGTSFLVNILKNSLSIETLGMLFVAFLFILYIMKNKYILSYFDSLVEKIILRKSFKGKKSISGVYKLITRAKGYGVYSVVIDEHCNLVGASLKDSNLKPHNIIILNIDKGEAFIGFPKRDYIIEKGDNVLLYGKVDEIIKIFDLEGKKVKDTFVAHRE